MNCPQAQAGPGARQTHISDVLEATFRWLVVWGAGPVLLRGALIVSVIVRA